MRVNWLYVGMAVLSFAGNGIAKDSQKSVPADMEFLEFLGRWETNDGEWIDPLSLDVDLEKTLESEKMKGGRLTGGEDDGSSFPKEEKRSIGEKDGDD